MHNLKVKNRSTKLIRAILEKSDQKIAEEDKQIIN